jgi:acyl phosphate:glycerol-3-phosphate acyltransferase
VIPFPPSAALVVSAVLAYLIGGLPFGYWFVRRSSGKDIRTMGSGNIGATNVHRTVGRKAGLVVAALDILKGLLAVWLTAVLTHGDPRALAISAVAVMLGHCYPVLLHFHGGKAVACFTGAFLYLAPLSLAVIALVFVAVVVLTKYISLASIVAALLFPLVVWLVTRPPQPILIASIAAAVLIVYRHKNNIARLRAGTEHVFSAKGGKAA